MRDAHTIILKPVTEPGQAIVELAGIFAASILRSHRAVMPPSSLSAEIFADSAAQRLELPVETVLSVSTRVNGDPRIPTRRDT